jgi:hypothetical protein
LPKMRVSAIKQELDALGNSKFFVRSLSLCKL